ncbi:hypothetical protein A4D02_24985 [Niastella koreensis]|uniref:Short-chain dehydrogenase/reductase SDR n=1 Tax=Niastella koreensis TaxID=354356 RepID=A0ABX3NZW5_9BACT|nr:hypothetical protein A4D02_24985 [Niastella koreensis]
MFAPVAGVFLEANTGKHMNSKQEKLTKTIVITGASSGVGKAAGSLPPMAQRIPPANLAFAGFQNR